jgi:hypothetical protein
VNTHQCARFRGLQAERDTFTAACGYDVIAWLGFPAPREMRDLRTLESYMRLADAGNERAATELGFRRDILRRGDRMHSGTLDKFAINIRKAMRRYPTWPLQGNSGVGVGRRRAFGVGTSPGGGHGGRHRRARRTGADQNGACRRSSGPRCRCWPRGWLW